MQQERPVLIIEDDRDIREALEQLLEAEGYKVYTAANGELGIERLKEIPHPCVILLDLFMPQMNGAEFLKKLKQDQADVIATLPVVLLSATPPESQAATEAQRYASGFIKKPIDLDALLNVVKRYCCAG